MILRVSPSRFWGGCSALALLLATSFSPALAALANPGGVDVDIPISELNKVKKKTPAKRLPRETKKKKKKVAKPEETALTAAPVAAAEPPVHAQAPPVALPVAPAVVQPAAQPETVQLKSPPAPEPAQEAERIRIHHTPYTFVVTGRRTVIYAVVSSKADIKEVRCSVSLTESGEPIQVTMVKVPGTGFTYMANLPPSPESGALRYIIDAVDSQGSKTRSREFVSTVAAAQAVPSWQSGDTRETVPAKPVEVKPPSTEASVPAAPR